MALAPNYQAHLLVPGGQKVHILEAFLDFCCPFSAKMFLKLSSSIFPLMKSSTPPIQFVFRHQVQPWHPQSSLMHEASLAVEKISPGKFYEYCGVLFQNQENFFDIKISNLTRPQITDKLIGLASQININSEELKKLLYLNTQNNNDKNVGSRVITELKYHIKLSRQLSVHVSPTVYFDGILESQVSSSWDTNKWKEFFEKRGITFRE